MSGPSLVDRLDQIAKHDWRVSLLAHTSDTASEAKARIAELEAALLDANADFAADLAILTAKIDALRKALEEAYERVASRDNQSKIIPFAEYAAYSPEAIDTFWDHDDRHLAHRIARSLLSEGGGETIT